MGLATPERAAAAAADRARQDDRLRVAAIQSRPCWLDPLATATRACELIAAAAARGADVVAFPETYLAGYPFWLSRTNGAAFDDEGQKRAYAAYLAAAVELSGPELAMIGEACAEHGIWAFVGCAERGTQSGRGTVYCSVAVLDDAGRLAGCHRKLMPTHDERLVWGQGDGAGLQAYEIGAFRVGALLCWENWMPQARWALYADGIDIHLSLWPGSCALTQDITRFIALEGRVWSVAAGGVLSLDDVPDSFPLAAELQRWAEPLPFDGGSAIADPSGAWIAEPLAGQEGLVIADCTLDAVREARLTFDVTGHYHRPDVFHTRVDRRARSAVEWRQEV